MPKRILNIVPRNLFFVLKDTRYNFVRDKFVLRLNNKISTNLMIYILKLNKSNQLGSKISPMPRVYSRLHQINIAGRSYLIYNFT